MLTLILGACQPKEPEIAVRLLNFSDERLLNVHVTFPEGEVDFGEMPPLSQTPHLNVFEANSSVPLVITMEEESFTLAADAEPVPFESGSYAYALHFANGEMQRSWVNDGEPHVDEQLVGTHWRWQTLKRADGTVYEPVSADPNEIPGILFTDSTSQNKALGGLLFGAYTGCNGGGGAFYTNTDNHLIMQLVTLDGEACSEEIVSAETTLYNVINGITTYKIENDTLHIFLPTGAELTFTP